MTKDMLLQQAVVTILALTFSIAAATPAKAANATLGELRFKNTDYPVQKLDRDLLPYNEPVPGPLYAKNSTYDSEGVILYEAGGNTYDHPVWQAQFVLSALSSYFHNNNPDYLAAARVNADRLIAQKVEARGAWYLPYHFGFPLHGAADDPMVAPWYSAMAQGVAISAMVRLYEVTQEPKYLEAADKFWATFTNPRRPGEEEPWTVFVDDEGYLWFEEYAKYPQPDRAFNGHVFAIYGLYDYWPLTGNPTAKTLFQGGVSAVAAHIKKIRAWRGTSFYCLAHDVRSKVYHSIHTDQMYQLFAFTGDPSFATWADLLDHDFPAYQAGGAGYVASGTHSAVKVAPSGKVVEERRFKLSAAESIHFGAREKLRGKSGIWLRVDDGTMAGYWVPEVPSQAFIKGLIGTRRFHPARKVSLGEETQTGYHLSSLGGDVVAKPVSLTRAATRQIDGQAVWNGMLHFRIAEGDDAGKWVPAQEGFLLETKQRLPDIVENLFYSVWRRVRLAVK